MEWYLWLLLGLQIGSSSMFLLWFRVDNKKWKRYTLYQKIGTSIVISFWEIIVLIVIVKETKKRKTAKLKESN